MPRTAAPPTVPFASQKKYRATHKETVKAVNRRYYENNKERLKAARNARYHSTNPPDETPDSVNESSDSVNEIPDMTISYNSQLGVYVLQRTQYDNDYKKQFLKAKLQEILNSL